MEQKLLDILACPICKGVLLYDKTNNELICNLDKLAFPIKKDIPVMLEEEARKITDKDSE